MTEAEWLASAVPDPMLAFLRGKVSDRKLRLFACSCCGLAWNYIDDERNRRAVELAERLADGAAAGRNELGAVRASARNGTAWCTIMDSAWDAACYAARSGAGDAARFAIRGKSWGRREERDTAWRDARAAARVAQAALLRDIFGPLPFRPVTLHPTWLAQNRWVVWRLAESIYNDRAFDLLPILADALEEAGCTNTDLLGHLRGLGPHVRGCFVLDLLLAKE
jgi:hypothetical protein